MVQPLDVKNENLVVIDKEGPVLFRDGKYLHFITIFSNGRGHAPIINYEGSYPTLEQN